MFHQRTVLFGIALAILGTTFTHLKAAETVTPVPGSAEWTRCNCFNDPKATWDAVKGGADAPIELRSLIPPVLLPDGSEFKTWEPAQAAAPRRTFYVAQQDAKASDGNPGTEARPWKTIGRAAQALEPGDCVVVKQGLYREWVRPARGGASPSRMVTYQAAPGEAVVLSGSDPLTASWKPSTLDGQTPVAKAWMVDLPESLFPGYNPFAEQNITRNMTDGLPGMAKKYGWLKPPYTLARGLIFQDGHRLKQVVEYADLAKADGSYWVAPGGHRLHVRPFGDGQPTTAAWEVTTRPFAFAPEKPGLGFIRVAGLTAEHVANCFPVPQLGAISTNQGHHWIVEKNVVRQTNGLGLDYGRRQTFLPWLVPADTPKLAGVGHILRGNAFYECGACSLSGLGLMGGLVEDNYSTGCGWHRVSSLCEAGGMKLHYLKHCLIRRNVVDGTVNCAGLWTDHSNHNTRITQNLVTGAEGPAYYLEASYGPNLIDQNVFWNCSEGVRLSATGNATMANNLIGCCKGRTIQISKAVPTPKGRMVDMETKRMASSDHNRVIGNVFFAPDLRGPEIPKDMDNQSDHNVFAWPADGKPFDLAAWRQKTGWDEHSQAVASPLEFSSADATLCGQVPVLEVPRIAEITADYSGAVRTGVTTTAGPWLKTSLKPKMILTTRPTARP